MAKNEMMEEMKFKASEKLDEIKIMLFYFFKEPFLEIKRMTKGYYNSVLLFWVSVATLVFFWKNHIGGYKIKIAIGLVIFSYVYSFFKSGRWKEYYEREYVKGEKLE